MPFFKRKKTTPFQHNIGELEGGSEGTKWLVLVREQGWKEEDMPDPDSPDASLPPHTTSCLPLGLGSHQDGFTLPRPQDPWVWVGLGVSAEMSRWAWWRPASP